MRWVPIKYEHQDLTPDQPATRQGESNIPFLRPGCLFDLQDHYRNNYNQTYLIIEIEHAGSHAA